MLCAALGRPRSAPLNDLAELGFGVRIERNGSVLRDYHTVGAGEDIGGQSGIAVASGSRSRGIVSERYYLQDAAFMVGLEGDDRQFLEELHSAVMNPRRMLALGRRSCPPSDPIADDSAICAGGLADALRAPWSPDACGRRSLSEATTVELILEDKDGPIVTYDQPIGAAFADRTFGRRHSKSIWVDCERSHVSK